MAFWALQVASEEVEARACKAWALVVGVEEGQGRVGGNCRLTWADQP